jgi:hypothetical protein
MTNDIARYVREQIAASVRQAAAPGLAPRQLILTAAIVGAALFLSPRSRGKR